MVTTTKTSRPSLSIPPFPNLEAAQDRLTKMQVVQNENKREAAALVAAVNGATSNSHRDKQLASAVDKLLNGGEVSGLGDDFNTLNEALKSKWAEGTVIKEAVAKAERQRDAEHAAAAQQLAEIVRPEYQKILKRMKAALLELQSAVLEEVEFYNFLEDANFSNVFSYVERMQFVGAGYIERDDIDPCCHVRTWMNQLAQHHKGV